MEHENELKEALGEGKKSAGATKLNLKELPKPVEIKKFLDQYVIGQDDAKRYDVYASYGSGDFPFLDIRYLRAECGESC